MNVRDNLINEAYNTNLPYPARVERPVVLNRKAADLTADEIVTLAQVKADYEAAQDAHVAARTAYNADRGRLEIQFRADVEAENGMTGHPKAALLWNKAWANGHSAGLSDVLTHYEDLVELVL